MQRSTNRVLTTHTGSLPRATDILETMRARATGQSVDQAAFASTAGNAEIPPTVAWAKLRALGEGARLATERMYKSAPAVV